MSFVSRRFVFVDAADRRFVSPLFVGSKNEFEGTENEGRCDITEEELTSLFLLDPSYNGFTQASKFAQAHFLDNYQNGVFIASDCIKLTKRDPVPPADEIIYVRETRGRDTVLAFTRRLQRIMELQGMISAIAKELEEFSEVLDNRVVDFTTMHCLTNCSVRNEFLYNADGFLLAKDPRVLFSDSNGKMMQYYINQSVGLEDDFYGTLFFPLDKEQTTFVAVGFCC